MPCITNNDFKLAESVAIVKYLSREYQIPDNWYPSNSEHRAQVDEYLDWQHLNTRLACAQLFQTLWIQPKMFGKPVDEKKLKEVQKYCKDTLDTIDTVWLGRQNKFLVSDQISVADLFAATEILQTSNVTLWVQKMFRVIFAKCISYFLAMCNYDPCEGRPNLKAWLELVKKTTNPHFDDAHQFVYKLASQGKPKL